MYPNLSFQNGPAMRCNKLPQKSGIHRFFVALLLILVSVSVSSEEFATAPDWTLSTHDGRMLRLSEEVQQQTAVLFFWATWCPYCKALMPHLQSIKLEYGEDVTILAINVFDDGDAAGFIERSGYDFTLLLNGEDVAKNYGVTGTPGVMIIDRERRIHFDLRQTPPMALPADEQPKSNSQKAAYMAPYWAMVIRKNLDSAL